MKERTAGRDSAPETSPASRPSEGPSPTALGRVARSEALQLGFDAVGIAPVRPSEHGAFYHRWLAAGRHGEMAYLARPDAVARRVDPEAGFAGARSVIVVAHNYFQEDGDDGAAADPARGVVARYARGRDYHRLIKEKLLKLLRRLEAEAGRELPLARAYVDTGPVLERELARRAGLGWFGRNTMLIHPRRGSYFFLGVLLVELELDYDEPFREDHCGTCRACLDACPTGALLGRDEDGAPVIDATRCISYLTIELRGPIPRELRPLMGNRVFGCDICQEVCPWNGPKFVQLTGEPDYRSRSRSRTEAAHAVEDGNSRERERDRERNGECTSPGTDAPSLVELMRMTREEWDAWTRGSAIRRAGYAGFKRNAAVALGNWLVAAGEAPGDAIDVLSGALTEFEPEPLVRGHAAWALGRVGSAEAREALSSALDREREPFVREELELALVDSGSIVK